MVTLLKRTLAISKVRENSLCSLSPVSIQSKMQVGGDFWEVGSGKRKPRAVWGGVRKETDDHRACSLGSGPACEARWDYLDTKFQMELWC